MNQNQHHESAFQHVTGKAQYVSDINLGEQMLYGRVVYSPYAKAKIVDYNLAQALKIEGVIDILDYKRIPGTNELNPLKNDEPCLAKDFVNCIGQAVFLIAAETEEAAYEAEKKISILYEPLPSILSIEDAIEKGNPIAPPRKIECGEPFMALKKAKHILTGELKTGAQEHWYLETQAALCVPGERRDIKVFASSQNPTETQLVVAEVLGINANEVECEVKRMGGGFGGKETQGNHVAAWAALLANATHRPVLLTLHRDDDQKITGKRHRSLSTYKVGFNSKGEISALIADINLDAGCATDLSMAILERALFHTDNAYYIPNVSVTGTAWRTNLPSNTAFRGFGGPQGMAIIENAIDSIARFLKIDAAEVRHSNFYGINNRNQTPYGQTVEHNRLFTLWDKIIAKSNYFERRKEINDFNSNSIYVKRGIALTPVKFGISFTTSFLNQAGALVLIYKDGTVLVNHGGTEMGQGLNTKILQIAAVELGLPIDNVKVNATNTSKVPNTSPTAASSGTDLNGMAVKNAIDELKLRLTPCAKKMLASKYAYEPKGVIIFEEGKIFEASHRDKFITFEVLVQQAHIDQISLHATGFYATPGIHFDRELGKGEPFNYFAFGMAVSEVEVDTLTGYTRLLRTDIVHDAGDSINPKIDLGQVTGGFIQGVGWCITETIRWSSNGKLLNHSPDTYKIPTIDDIPLEFNVELLSDAPNPKAIRKSKAVGEPPLMLAFSAWLAVKDAISAIGNHSVEPSFNLPANNEQVLISCEEIRAKMKNIKK
jgi:xanthine dehydrogenase molybdopterin binding subunit